MSIQPEKPEEVKPPAENLLLDSLKKTFLSEYYPATTFTPSVIFMSTREVFERFNKLCPGWDYTERDIAQWLAASGFNFRDCGTDEYKWMMQRFSTALVS